MNTLELTLNSKISGLKEKSSYYFLSCGVEANSKPDDIPTKDVQKNTLDLMEYSASL
ncbi:MAG: hypothetical protein QNK85_05985 [Crocinitomicaceae bacterium]